MTPATLLFEALDLCHYCPLADQSHQMHKVMIVLRGSMRTLWEKSSSVKDVGVEAGLVVLSCQLRLISDRHPTNRSSLLSDNASQGDPLEETCLA